MNIKNHLNKDNLHHAYLIEGNKDSVSSEIFSFLNDVDFVAVGNPDFVELSFDIFKIDDARNLKALAVNKNFTEGKRFFVIYANSMLLEAQNILLKIFEEPADNTHFFVVIPSTDVLIKTLISRFYLIKNNRNQDSQSVEIEKFIKMPLRARLDFVKELLTEDADDEKDQTNVNSPRAKAVKFLDDLESVLGARLSLGSETSNLDYLEHIFKVREYLRQPGSAPKMLLESVAIIVPNL